MREKATLVDWKDHPKVISGHSVTWVGIDWSSAGTWWGWSSEHRPLSPAGLCAQGDTSDRVMMTVQWRLSVSTFLSLSWTTTRSCSASSLKSVLFVVVVFCCCFTAQQVSSRERSCSLELVDIIYTEQRQSAVTSCNLTEAQVCCTRRCTLLYCTLTTVHSLHHTSPAHLINKWKIYIFTYFSLSLILYFSTFTLFRNLIKGLSFLISKPLELNVVVESTYLLYNIEYINSSE